MEELRGNKNQHDLIFNVCFSGAQFQVYDCNCTSRNQ